MKKLYFSLLSLMLISVVGFAQVSKPLVSHAKQADASKLYITGSQSMKGGEITTCPANSLFSSAYDAPSSAGTSEVNANGSNYQIATSFQTVGGTIETVHIWMLSMINTGSWATCDGDPMHVNVTFYENNAGAVGDVYATFTDITPTITPANLTLFGSYPVSFMSITLPSSVDLANGFVSVQGTTPSAGTDCWLMWVNAPNGGGTSYQSTDGVWGASGIGYTVCLEGTPAACPAPMNFQAINPDLNSIGLSWEQLGAPTAWNIEYGETGFTPTGTPTVSGVTENPYTVTGLDASTSYDFYIQADCGSIWVGPLTAATTACEAATACDYVFNLTDSYGDGWNGNFVTVLQDGIEIAVVTLGAGASGTQSVTLCPALPISLVWNLPAGDSWPEEAGFTLLNPYGEQLATYPATYFASTATGTEIFAFTSDCTPPACPMPTNLTATGITTTGASLGWTEAGSATAWNIEWGVFGFTQGAGTTVAASTNPYALGGLTAGTTYQFYVQADCGGAESIWAGPFTFSTACAIATTLNEGFEATVPPICWATFQNGAGTQMWASEGTIFNSGAKSAAAYYEGSGGENQQWLVTGQITVPVNHKLTFYTRDYFTTDYLSVLRVLVSTDADPTNTAAYTQLLQLAETDVTNANFTMFQIDFSEYAGQNVFIAFVMVDDDGDNWYLDVVKLEPNVGINNNVASNITMYPNPSNGIVTIANAEGASIEVLNVMGQVIASFNANSSLTTFDATNLSNGNYVVRIVKDNNTTVKTLNIIK